MAAFQSGRQDRSAGFQDGKNAARAGVHQAGAAPAVPAAEGCSLLRSGPVSSALLPKTQKRSIRTDRRRIKTGQRPDKTRTRFGRRWQNLLATEINLWQIGFDWIPCLCRISQNTCNCNLFSWSRLADLNPGPTHYERHGKAASLKEVAPLQATSLMELRESLRSPGLLAGH